MMTCGDLGVYPVTSLDGRTIGDGKAGLCGARGASAMECVECVVAMGKHISKSAISCEQLRAFLLSCSASCSLNKYQEAASVYLAEFF